MLDSLAKEMTETTKEVSSAETKDIPSFFQDLPEAKDIPNEPVLQENTNKITLITRNESLEGDVHPITGVAFERQLIEQPSGEIIEGVFPDFPSVFDAHISPELNEASDYSQFKECNRQLYEATEKRPELKEKFGDEQLEQIKDGMSNGTAPDGYVWHHNEQVGKIQLVDFDIHAHTGHTGGRTVWGGGNDNR